MIFLFIVEIAVKQESDLNEHATHQVVQNGRRAEDSSVLDSVANDYQNSVWEVRVFL